MADWQPQCCLPGVFPATLNLCPIGSINFWSAFRPKVPRDALGDRGENMAAKYLRTQGMKIIVRNFRTEVGEIDIIAREGKTLVFVEVKTRVDDDPTPEQQVNPIKQHQITKAVRHVSGAIWKSAAPCPI